MTSEEETTINVAIEQLDSAATPTKSEVFTACGEQAADLRDALSALLSEVERLRGDKARDPMLNRSGEEWDALEDAVVTVYAFKAGHTLSEEDIGALHLMDKCHREDEESATDAYHRGLEDGLRKRGGDELVQLEARVSKAVVERATERAMRRFAEVDAASHRARAERLEGALREIKDGWGVNHTSRFVRDLVDAALSQENDNG